MSGWKTWRVFPASQRLAREHELEPLSEFGFIVTSHEVSRDGPWRIEIFGQGARPSLDGDWTWETLPEKDWVAENQRSFQPFRVGLFWVHPSHIRDGLPAGLLPIERSGLSPSTARRSSMVSSRQRVRARPMPVTPRLS